MLFRSKLKPHFLAAVASRTLRADEIQDIMNRVLKRIAIFNAETSENQYRIAQEARRSDEWLKLCEEVERAAAPKSATGKRERGPDYAKSRARVELEDTLRSELGKIKSRTAHHTSLDQLRKDFPAFELWKLLSPKEQQELLADEFKPRAYARTLVANKFGLTSLETIKKDRQKLRRNKEGLSH